MRIIITSFALVCSLSAFSQNIVLDPFFGFEGMTFVDNTSEINKIILNPDGTIISAGYKIVGGGGYHIALTKHQADGIQDLNFGTGGITNTSIGVSDMIFDLKLQSDGKILLAGSAYQGAGSGTGGSDASYAFIARYHPNGLIDSSFGSNGLLVVTDYNDSQFCSIIIQSDNSLLLIGNADNLSYLTKLTPAGIPDTTFGTNGVRAFSDLSNYFFVNFGGIRLNDGSLLCYGVDFSSFTGSGISCAKIDSLGNFITSFGQNGIVSLDLDPDQNIVESISKAQELPDGKIILAGYATDKIILKLKADGTPDSTFATNGVLVHTLPFKDMLVQPNGKILIGGSAEISQFNYGMFVSRFNANGTIDQEFNSTGTFEADFSERNDLLQSMILAAPDQLLIAGSVRLVDFNPTFGLAKIDMSESLGLQSHLDGQIAVFPNPFSSELTISIPDGKSVTDIQLADATGRMIATYPASQSILSLENLTSGVYQLIVKTEQETVSKRLIKY